MAKKKLNIKKAIKKPGSLRSALGIKAGKTIPKAKLNKAAKAPGKQDNEHVLLRLFLN